MTLGTVRAGRTLTGVAVSALTGAAVSALCLSIVAPLPVLAAPTDPELLVTAELPQGDIDYDLELGTLHYFDREDSPFVVQVIDGCSVNGHLWVFGAGFTPVPLPLNVIDLRSAESSRVVLPAFEPGEPVGSIVDPEALAVCGDDPEGGLPSVGGTATFTAAGDRGRDYSDTFRLLSGGRDDAYRRLLRTGLASDIVSRGSPMFAVDDSDAYDELVMLVEGRTPGLVEGVVFFGEQGMLPGRDRLERALDDLTRARVRRAFETAKNRRVPRNIIRDLGLGSVDEVYHVSLGFDSLGADAYLQQARWIRTRGQPLEPPQPVEARFTVELVRANGERTPIPLVGPLVGSRAEGELWQHRSDTALVEIIDGCELGGSFWTVAAAITDEPVELVVTDTTTGASARHVLWTDREEVSRLSDTSSLPSCP